MPPRKSDQPSRRSDMQTGRLVSVDEDAGSSEQPLPSHAGAEFAGQSQFSVEKKEKEKEKDSSGVITIEVG